MQREDHRTESWRIVCECGHQGHLVRSESTDPYPWETYTVEEFECATLMWSGPVRSPKDVLPSLRPKCPDCRKVGAAGYA